MLDELELLPRRQEILRLIRHHETMTFAQIKTSFPGIPVSTLHNDLNQLKLKKFVIKQGKTKGVCYVLAREVPNKSQDTLKIFQY